ncbi:MAG: hypothetical protein ISEC1_P0435 [Thiomicrorhabdus sp.]|nr:MAG: hypothetical protein ISEC1_P0435 [Thiomicrorhabdus sp.]
MLPPLLISTAAFSLEISGKVGLEHIGFAQKAKYSAQNPSYSSVFIEPELYHQIDENSEIRAKLFSRYDANSTSRTHADIRELMFYQYADEWELHAGINKVFWGVTESRHLVDTINQTDQMESLDDESRLGQAMIHGKLIKAWGTVDLFVLPNFRPIQFGGTEVRPRAGLPIANADPLYQDSEKSDHIDYAIRWNHSIDNLDIALSLFNGTQRAPLLKTIIEDTAPKLLPVYVQSQQLGLEAQYIAGDMLLKAEALHRKSHKLGVNNSFITYDSNALVAGFEYTLIGINDTAYDLGIIGEYLYDEWADTTPFQKDWMTGLRFILNDEQSSEILLGHIYDIDDSSQMWILEASRRIGENWKAELTGRWETNIAAGNTFMHAYKQDDLIDLKLSYYY